MSNKLSITVIIVLIILSSSITFFVERYIDDRPDENSESTEEAISGKLDIGDSNKEINHLNRYQFIKPFAKPEPKDESPSFSHLKSKLNSYIEGLKKEHKLINASVYLRYFGHGLKMNINPEETYHPGSMLKVVNLVLHLKMSEQQQGFLEKKLLFNPSLFDVPEQTYNTKQIEAGKIYTVKELLEYMIVHSDNRASCLLMNNVPGKDFIKILSELKIPLPKPDNSLSPMTAYQFSQIYKLLYNSSYLSNENSEFALRLLAKTDFNVGLLMGVPEDITVVHKFGESSENGQQQLHESGLVYMAYAPYLITIMTKGNRTEDLPPVISNISKMVYDYITNMDE